MGAAGVVQSLFSYKRDVEAGGHGRLISIYLLRYYRRLYECMLISVGIVIC